VLRKQGKVPADVESFHGLEGKMFFGRKGVRSRNGVLQGAEQAEVFRQERKEEKAVLAEKKNERKHVLAQKWGEERGGVFERGRKVIWGAC